MPRVKSEPARLMDELEASLRPATKRWGFRRRGRTFNRPTRDGLTQAISLQMGSFDPPGTTYFPGLRENLYGRFTVNLGVYVPEVARHHGGGRAPSFVQVYHCCVSARLGELGPERRDLWWRLGHGATAHGEIEQRLERDGLPFLERFATRDAILGELLDDPENIHAVPSRIVCAIVLLQKGRQREARVLLAAQASESQDKGHTEYVRRLAEDLGLGKLGG